MFYWQTACLAGQSPAGQDFARIWQAALSLSTRLDLELLDSRTFASGAVYLSYRPRPA